MNLNPPRNPRLPVLGAAALLGLSQTLAADFESNLDKTFPTDPGGRLILDVDRGNVSVTTGGEARTAIQVFRAVRGGSKEKADKLFADHEVTFQQDGPVVRVTATTRSQPKARLGWNDPPLEVRYEITLPQRFDLTLKTAAGNVEVGPTLDGDATTRTAAGNIALKTISGVVEASTSGGNITVAEARTNATLRTSAGNIRATRVGGKLDARTSGGSVSLDHGEGDADLHTSAGGIRVGHITGKLVARTSGGSIEVGENGGETLVETSAGNLKLGKVRGPLTATTRGGGVTVEHAFAGATVKTSAGNVNVTFASPPELASRLETSGGSMTVGLPASAAVDLDARASGGSVKSELPVTAQITEPAKSGELRGKINGGGPVLFVRTSAGNIRINKSADAAN